MGKGLSMVRLQYIDCYNFHVVLVTFDEPWISRVTVAPDADQLRVPPHIHENYVESSRVVQGKMKYTIDGVSKIYTPED
ncbi:hypothetical protein BS17DRAFT_781046 [Gyrodon lividus]|nr:hypothetical protein BS17DRAFT_781046 [Gyrodon lividus]